jgi:succinyl-CoA synthetase beta subunit
VKLHEYQAKELFAAYGIPVQRGAVIEGAEQVGGLTLTYPLVLKAQVLVGGRGKAGGVKLASRPDEALQQARAILGMSIKGERVNRLLVAEAAEIRQEHYFAFIVDRATRTLTAIASAAGGIDIEEAARTSPERIARRLIDPFVGFQPFHARGVGRAIGLSGTPLGEFVRIAVALYRLCVTEDAELAEINPLAVTSAGMLAVDAKLILDDNAAFRHPARPANEEMTPLEQEAREAGLSYVELDGDIAIIGNGAGLVMSTLDIVAHFGGRPANFLDVGGGASAENMAQAISIVVRKSGVKTLFVNIFGGITRCDDIARGIVSTPTPVPMVVRLTGTNEDEGRAILEAAGVHAFLDPEEAAQRVVAL